VAAVSDASVNVDNLPASQYLVLEVLAARYRLGEPFWTFPSRFRRALIDAHNRCCSRICGAALGARTKAHERLTQIEEQPRGGG
jgi:hypothetical protein